MGIDVVLMEVSRPGTSPKRRQLRQVALVADADDVLAGALPASGKPMLSRVDPYGDLILTPAEMDQFIAEAESLLADADVTEAERINLALELARQCRDNPCYELHLQGD